MAEGPRHVLRVRIDNGVDLQRNDVHHDSQQR